MADERAQPLTAKELAALRAKHTGPEHQCQTCMHPRPCQYDRLLATVDALAAVNKAHALRAGAAHDEGLRPGQVVDILVDHSYIDSDQRQDLLTLLAALASSPEPVPSEPDAG